MGNAELGLLLSGTHLLLCTRETFPKITSLSSTGPGYINQRQYHSKGALQDLGERVQVWGCCPAPLCRGMAGFGHPRGPREGGSRIQCPSDQVSASGNYCPHSPSDHPDSGPPSLTT